MNIICPMQFLTTLIIVCVLAMAGCTSLGPGSRASGTPSSDTVFRDCADHFNRLDAAIDDAGVHDGAEARVPGFPYLRVNRFLASFVPALAASFGADPKLSQPGAETTFQAWMGAMRELDRASRDVEISNLPAASGVAIAGLSKQELTARTGECAKLMMGADAGQRHDSAKRNAIIDAVNVPDDYSNFKRALGIYPLAKYPFFRGVEGWQRNAAITIKSVSPQAPANIGITRYVPSTQPSPRQPSESIVSKFKRAEKNALGVVTAAAFSDADWQQLFEAYAPIYEIETTTENDRIGALQWRVDSETKRGQENTPAVNTDRPTSYRRVAYTRINGKSFAQLVYSVWFPSRPRRHLLDLLSGSLDSIIWRVTLDEDGTPLIYDSIHACGCYHMFFPTPRMQPKPAPAANTEWVFVPKSMPTLGVTQRITLRVAAESHYILGVDVGIASSRNSITDNPGVIYEWRDDNELRKLNAGRDLTRSIFQSSGIIAGTERAERFLFWPMGIDSAGAMRQWGRHATAFVGVRHFDDADLFDLRFNLVQAPGMESPVLNKR